jgi:hypothetical protein
MPESEFSGSIPDVGQGSLQLIEQGDDFNIIIDCNICKAPEHVLRYLGRRIADEGCGVTFPPQSLSLPQILPTLNR